jgi:sigma-B regulation protein RsbU (phosphoserine phosphatase)
MTSFGQPAAVAESMKCMEVCGGHGESHRYYARPGLDVWAASEPKQDPTAGGGDLHLISSCASGRVTRMLIADVCGFGPLFQDVASRLSEIMRRNVNVITQARPVRQMSQLLSAASERGGFASTLMSTYFAPTRSLTLCNAGHPPPMVYRQETGEWSLMKQPFGVMATDSGETGVVDPGEYQQFTTRLALGDMVLAFSNSLTECRRGDGRTLGLDGLLDYVRQFDPAMPAAIPAALLHQRKNENPENVGRDDATDDATVLLCQATDTPVSWKDNLLAPFRLFRGASDRTSLSD